ncbi:hypothetical protein DFS34DRAFT_75556 [Phlyctochytrium arcticum]|nr:hypothetical protein DFS34DRAFT_75556 [Phlyctochytrium arcticum]
MENNNPPPQKRSLETLEGGIPSGSTKRRKSLSHNPTHVPSCTDPKCTGCSSGEIEIQFTDANGVETTTKPSAADLYRMALEERDGADQDEEGGIRAVVKDGGVDKTVLITKLFEMSLREFEKVTGIPAIRPLNEQSTGPQVMTVSGANSASMLNTHLMYASCLLDFGVFVPLPVYIQRSVDVFSECISTVQGAGKAYLSSWGASAAQFGLGRAQMELARCRYPELDRDDDGEEEGEQDIPVEESELVKQAKETLDKGLESVKADRESWVKQMVSAAGLFRDYAVAQRSRSSTKRFSTLQTALSYLSQAASAFPDLMTLNQHAIGSKGACLYYLADHYMHGSESERELVSKTAKDAAETLGTAISVWEQQKGDPVKGAEYLQLQGQSLILLSTTEGDEDLAVEYFERGVQALKRAFGLDPGNEDLSEQLELLEGMDEEGGGGAEGSGSSGDES